jgi:dTDP-4-amino-4,6-dideoxygalactose transaminase
MHLQPVFENAKFYGSGVCEKLFENGLCLPSSSSLSVENKRFIEEKVKEIL